MTYLENNTYLRPDKSLLNTFTITTVNTKLEKIVNEPEIPKKKKYKEQIYTKIRLDIVFLLWSINFLKHDPVMLLK